MRFADVTDLTSPRRGAHGFVFLEPCEAAPDGKFCVTVRTTQTRGQIQHNVAADKFDCAVSGFLSPTLERGSSGETYRPIIGRVGLTRAETRELERRAAASVRGGRLAEVVDGPGDQRAG
ncbi:MAG: hypothetical protein ACRYG8_23325 [Janthinobacterium lividum]